MAATSYAANSLYAGLIPETTLPKMQMEWAEVFEGV